MNFADVIIIIAVAAALVFAFYLNRKRKRTGSCCGDCSKCSMAVRPDRRVKKACGYEARVKITGMSCKNCAVKVQNALNALPSVNAVVSLEKRTATVLCGKEPDEGKIRSAVSSAGYGVESFEIVKRPG